MAPLCKLLEKEGFLWSSEYHNVCVRGGVQSLTHHLYLYISESHSQGSQGTKYVFNVVAKKFLIPKSLVLLAGTVHQKY